MAVPHVAVQTILAREYPLRKGWQYTRLERKAIVLWSPAPKGKFIEFMSIFTIPLHPTLTITFDTFVPLDR
jgi:hypothetical protein